MEPVTFWQRGAEKENLGLGIRNPTMDDVARRAGVSKATVSRVINGVEGAAATETVDRIMAAVDELGYVVNAVAASLKSGKVSTAGLIVPDASEPFFGAVTSGVESVLRGAGLTLLLANTNNDVTLERKIVRLLLERQIHAIIIAPSSNESSHLTDAQERGVTLVTVSSTVSGLDCDSVTVDDEAASYSAVRRLVELGHQRIGIITGPLATSADKERLAGYRNCLLESGIQVHDQLMVTGDFTIESGRQAMRKLLEARPEPSAVFVTADNMTLGALSVLHNEGIVVPRDMSVVCWDDLESYAFCDPPITAIAQPGFELGAEAAERLRLRLTLAQQPASRTKVLSTTFRQRASTTSPPMLLR